jgi:hypothetical protein
MPQALRTAGAQESIWKPISETAFRQNVVKLLKITDLPVVPGSAFDTIQGRPSAASGDIKKDGCHMLPIELEQSLANDFAFLAAADEGARSVTACCIEEDKKRKCLAICLASNDGVPANVRDGLRSLCDMLAEQLTGGEMS